MDLFDVLRYISTEEYQRNDIMIKVNLTNDILKIISVIDEKMFSKIIICDLR